MKDWKKHYARKIIVEEYYISVPTQYDKFTFKIHYVRHNGFTLIMPLQHAAGDLSKFGELFVDWFKIRSDFNTRYDKPHWWHPIRFNRKKKLVIWALNNIDLAYSEFKREIVDKTINE